MAFKIPNPLKLYVIFQNNMKSYSFFIMIFLALANHANAGTVIESTTGKPLKDVLVIEQRSRTFFEHTSCVDNQLSKTDGDGDYSIPFSLSIASNPYNLLLYKAGYRESGYNYLQHDLSTGVKRLEYLQHLARSSECYGDSSEKNSVPFVQAIVVEAISITKSPEDTRVTGEICKELGYIASGTSLNKNSSSNEADDLALSYIKNNHPMCWNVIVKASWRVPEKLVSSVCSPGGCTEKIYYQTGNAILNEGRHCATFEECNELANLRSKESNNTTPKLGIEDYKSEIQAPMPRAVPSLPPHIPTPIPKNTN